MSGFPARHKFIVLAHDEKRYRELGRLVATADRHGMRVLGQAYIRIFMQGLEKPATRARHANVLQHFFGFLKKHLDPEAKRELLEVIDRYRRGQLPLLTPISLLRQYLLRFPIQYLNEQYYLTFHIEKGMMQDST